LGTLALPKSSHGEGVFQRKAQGKTQRKKPETLLQRLREKLEEREFGYKILRRPIF